MIYAGVGDEGIAKLSQHYHSLIDGIVSGSWTHLPKTSVIRKKLRSLKLSDWKFKVNDFADDEKFREYDNDVKAFWPTKSTLRAVVFGLREKVPHSHYSIVLYFNVTIHLTLFLSCRWSDRSRDLYSVMAKGSELSSWKN